MADEATLKLVIVGGRGRSGTVGGPAGTSTPPAGRTVGAPPARDVDAGGPSRRRQIGEVGNALDAVAAIAATLRYRMGSIVGQMLGSMLDATAAWQKMAARGQPASGEAIYKAPSGAFDLGRTRYGGYRPDEVPSDVEAYKAAQQRREAQADFRRRYTSAPTFTGKGLSAAQRSSIFTARPGKGPTGVLPSGGLERAGETFAANRAATAGAGVAMGLGEIAGAAAGPLAVVGAVIGAMVALKSVTLNAVNAVGNFATGIASPDPNPAKLFEALGEHVTSSTEKLIYLGNALGILGPVVGDTTRNFGRLMNNLDALARRYEEFNAPVAQAVAFAEVRQTLGDIRRGQQLGGDLGRYIDAQSRLQQEYEDLKVQLLQQILPAVTDAVEAGRGILHVVKEINKVMPVLEIAMATSPLIQIIRLLGRLVGKSDEDEAIVDPLSTILEERGILVP